jgi:hypothetical protein
MTMRGSSSTRSLTLRHLSTVYFEAERRVLVCLQCPQTGIGMVLWLPRSDNSVTARLGVLARIDGRRMGRLSVATSGHTP